MAYESTFKISGDVTDRRELTSDKNKSWRGYVVKIAAVGAEAVEGAADAGCGDGAGFGVGEGGVGLGGVGARVVGCGRG